MLFSYFLSQKPESTMKGSELVEKLRSVNEEQLIKLIRMHLLFTIDCCGDNLSSLFDGEPKHHEGNYLQSQVITLIYIFAN